MSATPSARILVVDDDGGVARLIEKRLRREGFAVEVAHSGAVAFAAITASPPTLLLLDLKLPDFGAAEIIDRLARENRRLPFVIITGQGDERAAVEMMKNGARDYLVKDARFLELVPSVVRRVIGELGLENRLAEAEKSARLGQTLVEHSYTAVLVVTAEEPPTGIYANPAFTRLTGLAAGQVAGRKLDEIEQRIGPLPELRRALETGQPVVGERILRRHRGRETIVDCQVAPVPDHAGRHGSWALIQSDVTERQRLENEVQEVSAREQRRIGQDLHDGLGQHLTAIELMCETLRNDLSEGRPGAAELANEISQHLRETITQTRLLARGLAPFSLKSGGLREALAALAEMTAANGKVACRAELPRSIRVGDEAAVQLYRIAQEALNNALKHSQATEITLRVRPARRALCLEVLDNGKGLRRRARGSRGMGLGVMRHRSSLIGAELAIHSSPGKGTRVTCTLPLPP